MSKKVKPLYCLVANDELELIVRYGESLKELGLYIGATPQYIYKLIKAGEPFNLKLKEYGEPKSFKIEVIR
jgi:hypothetical protein